MGRFYCDKYARSKVDEAPVVWGAAPLSTPDELLEASFLVC